MPVDTLRGDLQLVSDLEDRTTLLDQIPNLSGLTDPLAFGRFGRQIESTMQLATHTPKPYVTVFGLSSSDCEVD
jgi:hypothetical protein